MTHCLEKSLDEWRELYKANAPHYQLEATLRKISECYFILYGVKPYYFTDVDIEIISLKYKLGCYKL